MRLGAATAMVALLLVSLSAGYQRFHAIPDDVRQAMAEVREQAPPDARFAVITDAESEDPVVEWFRLLADRQSLGTYMGVEWAGADAWRAALDRYSAIRDRNLPSAITHVFEATDRRATWGERDAPGSPASP